MSELDQSVIIIGPPKHGKSSIAFQLVREHLATHATGIALVHDTNGMFSRNGLCARYETTAAYRAAAAAARKEKRALPRGASFSCGSDEIAKLAHELGRLHNRDIDVRVPIMLVYDEAALMDGSGSTHISPLDKVINSNRRHLGVAPVYNIQWPTMLTRAFYVTATDAYVFSMRSPKDTDTLEEYLGLADRRLLPLVGRGQYEHVHWKQGKGLV